MNGGSGHKILPLRSRCHTATGGGRGSFLTNSDRFITVQWTTINSQTGLDELKRNEHAM